MDFILITIIIIIITVYRKVSDRVEKVYCISLQFLSTHFDDWNRNMSRISVICKDYAGSNLSFHRKRRLKSIHWSVVPGQIKRWEITQPWLLKFLPLIIFEHGDGGSVQVSPVIFPVTVCTFVDIAVIRKVAPEFPFYSYFHHLKTPHNTVFPFFSQIWVREMM